MFWKKKEENQVKDDDAHMTLSTNAKSTENQDNEITQMGNIIEEALSDGKKERNFLREKANTRAESLGLNKFPVCITF